MLSPRNSNERQQLQLWGPFRKEKWQLKWLLISGQIWLYRMKISKDRMKGTKFARDKPIVVLVDTRQHKKVRQ